MLTIITAFVFLVLGLILRPKIVSLINKRLVNTFKQDLHRFEIEFQIQFYNQPSPPQVGANGNLTVLEPIKINVDAKNEEEAITLFAEIIKHEIKTDLISIKQVF